MQRGSYFGSQGQVGLDRVLSFNTQNIHLKTALCFPQVIFVYLCLSETFKCENMQQQKKEEDDEIRKPEYTERTQKDN